MATEQEHDAVTLGAMIGLISAHHTETIHSNDEALDALNTLLTELDVHRRGAAAVLVPTTDFVHPDDPERCNARLMHFCDLKEGHTGPHRQAPRGA